jgi:4-hydroxy-tetrahydrodipicolinate synthase
VIEGGASGVVPCGTTGESPTLSHNEHDAVVASVVEATAGRVPVVAGTGSNSTAEAVRLTRAAEDAGASAVLSVCPYYNRPSQEGLARHFEAIADATRLPVVLYDIPGRSAVTLSLDTVRRLARHPQIRAIKEATGKLDRVTEILSTTNLAVLSGDDALTLPLLALGGTGVISVLSNLLPRRMTRLVEAGLSGDIEAARMEHSALEPLMKAMFLDTNPIPVKTALGILGHIDGELRLPLCSMTPANTAALEAAMQPFLGDMR